MLLTMGMISCGDAQLNKELANINSADAKLRQEIKILNREISIILQNNDDVTSKLKQRDAAQAKVDSLNKRKEEILKIQGQ